ncbi:rhamnulokinase [Pseudonocardia cypriaca]|uniref:Rhamnulokinase n=1 Tax=Pseudonocardia cypriaca TaxID=882449 RepID=A0A543FU82_9PSEU|nr:rhamnulokinase family protein [Pseudonocardia cypriaca]TQM37376.1 rhamnulokinase [Pseudonocardia cypriaca]
MRVAAVDLGASSGRVMVAEVGADRLELTEVARFPNGPVRLRDTLHWDVLALYRGILEGLHAAGPELDAVGIDSWGVDYGLLDATGGLLGNPVHHRDRRTEGVAERVKGIVPPADLYAATGVQVMPINTIYQLVAALGTPQLAAARDLLLMPDLLAYWLTGVRRAEVTNASTTGLLDVSARRWSDDVARRVGVDPAVFAPLIEAGERIGELSPHVLAETGLSGPVPVIAVGSHDTASAVVGVPAEGERFAFISCGTWSLVGVELPAPVLTEASRAANFSNELGVDGTVRYLRNVMGLWLLQECLRAWPDADLLTVLDEAAAAPAFGAVVDAGDPEFLAPGGMPERIADACRRLGQDAPAGRGGIVRCVLESLALAHRRVVRQASALSGREVEVVHVVGGGARNALLCQLTADACGLPVVAGPVEATALGNVLVQARALGAVQGDLAALRALLRATQPLTRYEPRGDEHAWAEAERRLERTPARA